MGVSNYRSDIDGLRALAILPVLFFHAQIPGFSGGFVGVDTFFVISGYLITSILAREFDEHKYRVTTFYERRIRRIFPALLTVLLFTLLVSPFFLLPSEFKALGRDALSSLLFVANINFWLQSGYFAADSETKPLLHMWSLGVEEQFYLFMPFFLWLIFRYARKHCLILIGGSLLLSLALCIYFTPAKPSASFYMLPTRAWELLVGAWLAIYSLSQARRNDASQATLASHIQGLTGLGLVLYAVFFFSEKTDFPGYAALAPVIGSALLINAGPGSLINRVLGLRPLVKIGLISYSLYLWHWPLIVFFRDAGWLNSTLGKLGVVAISFIAAQLTLYFIESPTRSRTKFPVQKLIATTLGFSVLVLVVAIVSIQLRGWPTRFSGQSVAFDHARDNISPARLRCHADGGLPDPAKSCVLGEGEAKVAVWADSHGVELSQALAEVGVSVHQLTYSACTPAIGYSSRSARPLCSKHNQQVLEYLLANREIDTIVLTTYFNSDQSVQQIALMRETAERLNKAGKNVIVVGPTPILDEKINVPTWLARGGSRYFEYSGPSMKDLQSQFADVAHVFAPQEIFCKASSCDLLSQGKPILFDSHHPSMHASQLVAKKLLPLIPLSKAKEISSGK